jgi:hypothetical protein
MCLSRFESYPHAYIADLSVQEPPQPISVSSRSGGGVWMIRIAFPDIMAPSRRVGPLSSVLFNRRRA